MNLNVTSRAIRILRILIMLRTARFHGTDIVSNAVTSQTKLIHLSKPEQAWVRGSMGCMTRSATVCLQRCMFVSEGTLLVRVALNTSRIGTRR